MKKKTVLCMVLVAVMVLAVVAVVTVGISTYARYSSVNELCELIKAGDDAQAIAKIETMQSVNSFSVPIWLQPIATMIEVPIKTPLEEACLWGRVEVVEALLEHGADPNLYMEGSWTPIEATFVYNGNNERLQIAQLLVDHGADIDLYASGESALFRELSRVMYGRDVTKAERDYSGECIAFLLEHGATPVNEKEETIVHYLAGAEDAQLLQNFINDHQKYWNACDRHGKTLLMWAANLGSTECVQYLIESGADTALTSAEGKTAYDYAVEKGYEEIAQLLRPEQ